MMVAMATILRPQFQKVLARRVNLLSAEETGKRCLWQVILWLHFSACSVPEAQVGIALVSRTE
jgi:hypothetical protein